MLIIWFDIGKIRKNNLITSFFNSLLELINESGGKKSANDLMYILSLSSFNVEHFKNRKILKKINIYFNKIWYQNNK